MWKTKSSTGIFVQDLVDDGEINFEGNRYLTAGGKGFGISALTSAYDYITWDRFSYEERMDMITNEFESDIFTSFEYDKDLNPYQYNAVTDWMYDTNISYFSKSGLESRSMARSTAYHELVHQRHFAENGAYWANEHLEYSEQMGHLKDMLMTSRQTLPSRYWFRSYRSLEKNGYKGGLGFRHHFRSWNVLFNILK